MSPIGWFGPYYPCLHSRILAYCNGNATDEKEAEMELAKRLFDAPKSSFFLFGPRGTGKTTALRMLYPHAQMVDLLDAELYRRMQADPNRIREYALIEGVRTLVIDEVQRVPDLLPVIHQLMEGEGRHVQFILTGSSARKLRCSGVDLLAGRAVWRNLHPFIAAELKDWNLNKALDRGQLPLTWRVANATDILRTYLALYMEQEVKNEGIVRNLPAFARFLEVISFSQGALLNAAQIAREIGISRNTVTSYLEILKDLLLSFHLPVFSKRAKRHLVSHDKFYFFDCGVFRSIRPKGPLDRPEEVSGAALEGLVAQHLRCYLDYSGINGNLYFWRTKSGNEVDFIVYGENIFWAIEVKFTANIRDADLSGLVSFGEDYPEAKRFFLYQGKEQLNKKGITCLPCELFLRELKPVKS